MKKVLIAALIAVILFGCDNNHADKNTRSTTRDLSIEVVDGCEYVFYRPSMNNGGAAITHHAACHNPIHGYYPQIWEQPIDITDYDSKDSLINNIPKPFPTPIVRCGNRIRVKYYLNKKLVYDHICGETHLEIGPPIIQKQYGAPKNMIADSVVYEVYDPLIKPKPSPIPMKKDNTIYVLGCYTAKQKAQLLNNIASSFAQISFYEEYPTDNPNQYCFKIGIYVPE